MAEKGKLRALDPLLHPQYDDMLHKKSSFVEHFYQLVTQSIEPPFAISIDGLWGTGKTTVMQMLQNKLQERDGGHPVFWFNPWEYRKTGDVVLAFLQQLAAENRNRLQEMKESGGKIFKVLALLGMEAIVKISTGAMYSLDDVKEAFKQIESQQAPHEKYIDLIASIKEEFRELINTISKEYDDKPVLIFFDDLDRCLPDDAIALLEALKNLFVTPKCQSIFVCGIDTHIAKQFIKAHYKDIEDTFAINYFRKIFNLTVSMPHSSDMKMLLIHHIQDLYGWDEQRAEELANTVYYTGLQAEMESVRKYLNVINNFYMFQKFNPKCKDDKEKEFILHLFIVKEAWQPLYEQIVKKASRERTRNMRNLLLNVVTTTHKLGEYSLTERQWSFLSDYFTSERTSFHELNLAEDFLYKYPTLT